MKLSNAIIIGTLITLISGIAVAENRKQYGTENGLGTPTYLDKLQVKTDDFHRKGFITNEQYKNQNRSIELNKFLKTLRIRRFNNTYGSGKVAR